MSRGIIFAIILLLNSNLFAQSNCDCYDRLYNLSMSYKLHNNKEMALNTFKDAISFIQDSNQIGDYYSQLAELFLYYKETDSAIVYFTKGIKYGSSIVDYDFIKTDYDYREIYAKIDTNLLKEYDLKFKSYIDTNLYHRYLEARDLDQSIRVENDREYILNKIISMKNNLNNKQSKRVVNNGNEMYNIITMDVGEIDNHKELLVDIPDSIKQIAIDKVFNFVDSVNFIFINDIFQRYGFPHKFKNGFGIKYVIFALHIIPYDSLNKTCDFPEKSAILVFMEKKKYCLEQKSLCGKWGGSMNKIYMEIEDINKADSIRFLYNDIRIKEEALPSSTIPKEYKSLPYPKNYFCLKKYHFD